MTIRSYFKLIRRIFVSSVSMKAASKPNQLFATSHQQQHTSYHHHDHIRYQLYPVDSGVCNRYFYFSFSCGSLSIACSQSMHEYIVFIWINHSNEKRKDHQHQRSDQERTNETMHSVNVWFLISMIIFVCRFFHSIFVFCPERIGREKKCWRKKSEYCEISIVLVGIFGDPAGPPVLMHYYYYTIATITARLYIKNKRSREGEVWLMVWT